MNETGAREAQILPLPILMFLGTGLETNQLRHALHAELHQGLSDCFNFLDARNLDTISLGNVQVLGVPWWCNPPSLIKAAYQYFFMPTREKRIKVP